MSSNKNEREPRRGRIPHGQEPRDDAGHKLCRWCREPVPPKRRTFCSEQCVHEHRLRSNVDYMRAAVLRRDHGICAVCGRDCLALADEAKGKAASEGGESSILWLIEEGYDTFRARECLSKGKALWDAAHKVPVNWGGGGCGVDGMRTLCCPCHKRETRIQKSTEALGVRNPNQETLWGTTVLEEVLQKKKQG